MSTRVERSEDEHVTIIFTEDNDLLVRTDDGPSHVIGYRGGYQEMCTCEDNRYREGSCKHQIAWERWNIDEIRFGDDIIWERSDQF